MEVPQLVEWQLQITNMKANINDNPYKAYPSLPDTYIVDGRLIMNYNTTDAETLYQHGWRDVVVPELNDTEKLGSLILEGDAFTFEIIQKTAEEIQDELMSKAKIEQDLLFQERMKQIVLQEIQSYDDQKALENIALYPIWQQGDDVKEGEKRQSPDDEGNMALWKCLQDHITDTDPKYDTEMWTKL